MYRRHHDGKFQFLHWDSDLGFRENNNFYDGRRDFKAWMEKPYNMRLFNFFSKRRSHQIHTQLVERMKAWLELERDASNQYNPDINFYNNFNGRGPRVDSFVANNKNVQFTITTKSGLDFTTSNSSETFGQGSHHFFRRAGARS